MNVVEPARALYAGVTRMLPPRGLNRKLWRSMNRLFLQLGADPAVRVRMKSGLCLDLELNARSQVDAYYSRVYEAESLRAILALYDGDGLFLDVGANIGFYAAAIAQHIARAGGTGHVFCFEPFARNVERLTQNLELNGLSGRCTIVPLGLSNEQRQLDLVLREDFRDGASSGNASVAIGATLDAGFAVTPIRVVPLDTFWAERGDPRPIAWIKADIEGHEDCFLQGARATLERHRPTIMMEVNKTYFAAKRVDLDQAIRGALPAAYRLFRRARERWTRFESFAQCGRFENVLLAPEESSHRMEALRA